ncbi:flagellar basal body rod protein FlgC [bacterium]|nr:flagellar basal body rod protein FlgC [bacterium]
MKIIPLKDHMFRGNIYRSIDIAASGMTTQRQRMDAIASNIANAQVTNVDGNGSPYLRKHVVMSKVPDRTFEATLREYMIKPRTTESGHIPEMSGSSRVKDVTPLVEGSEIEIPNMRKNVVYDPSHPDADADGFVVYPDINVIEEMTDLMVASRAFDANVTVVNAAKQMIMRSLDI